MNFRQLPIRTGGTSSSTAPRNLTIADGGKASGSDTHRIRVYWGLINNMQADEFSYGDTIPLYFNVSGERGIIYAQQVANLRTRQWISANIKILNNTTLPSNTRTTIYTMLGTYLLNEDSLSVVSWGGGDIYHSFCELSVN